MLSVRMSFQVNCGGLLLLLVLWGANARAGEPRLVPSSVRPAVTIPSPLEGKRLAMYGGGALGVAEGDMAEPNLFSVYGADGRLQAQRPLAIPGASRVVVYDDSRSAARTLVASGFAESPQGHRAPYLQPRAPLRFHPRCRSRNRPLCPPQCPAPGTPGRPVHAETLGRDAQR